MRVFVVGLLIMLTAWVCGVATFDVTSSVLQGEEGVLWLLIPIGMDLILAWCAYYLWRHVR